jgi:TM2 domain-containing membrane protein YozV
MSTTYYYRDPEGREYGPYTLDELERRYSGGELDASGLVAEAGGETWQPLSDLLGEPGAAAQPTAEPPPPPAAPAVPPPMPGQTMAPYARPGYTATGPRPKCDRTTYILLGLLPGLVGVFGIHNLLAGYTGRAIGQLILSALFWLSLWFCVGFVFYAAAFIWTIVDCVQTEHDVNGVPMES